MMTLISGLPEAVAANESIARFLTTSGHFNSSGPRDRAFLPNPKDGKTSVCRPANIALETLKSYSTVFFRDGRKVYGAAVFLAETIRQAQLEIESSEPPPRHANITKWPWMKDDKEFGKAESKSMAKYIASKASTVLFD